DRARARRGARRPRRFAEQLAGRQHVPDRAAGAAATSAGVSARSSAGGDFMNHSVLVVEDEQPMRTMLEDNLEYDGYSVTAVGTGEDALSEIERRGYSLVLLDVMLPGISGLDVCRRLRSRGTHVPVIMLTARTQEPDRVTGLDVGADDYVSK